MQFSKSLKEVFPSAHEKIESLASIKKSGEHLVIHNDHQYAIAEQNFEAITARIRDLDELRKTLKAPILEAARNVDSVFKKPIESGKDAKRTIQKKLLAYTSEYQLPKAGILSTRANWKYRLIDLNVLIQAICKGEAPTRLIAVNNTVANQFAKSVRDTLPIPGLEFYNDESLQKKRRGGNHETE